MEAVIVTGQYGVGKTTTINNLLPDIMQRYGRVGVFVAESANIAPDVSRFVAREGNATGVSFASVCCPTLDDMRQALSTAVEGKEYDMLLVEPPGNMDPRYCIDALLSRDITPLHVALLVSQNHYETDKLMPTFRAALSVASVIGITRRDPQHEIDHLVDDLALHIVKGTPIIKHKLRYDDLLNTSPWTQRQGLTPILSGTERVHSDHYARTIRLIDPSLSCESIVMILKELAEGGRVSRAKGSIPQHQKIFDIKGNSLDIQPHPNPDHRESLGYIAAFSTEKLPIALLDRLSVPSSYTPRPLKGTESPQERQRIFARLFEDSKGDLPLIIGGKVPVSFDPVDFAYKVASEIQTLDGDSNALRMILVPRIRTR